MNSLITEIEQKRGVLSKAQQLVADYILQESVAASFSTIDKIAHASGVSTATVVRFASSLGFSGFTDFQNALQQYFVKGHPDRINRFALNDQLANIEALSDEERNVQDALESLTRRHIDNLNKTLSGMNYDTLRQVINTIASADHIYVAGARTSQAAAEYLNFTLQRSFANSTYLLPEPSLLLEKLSGIRSGDVVIVFCVSHYYRFTLDVVRVAKIAGATVIGIFDREDTPLSPYVDLQLTAACKTNVFHNSALSLIYISDIIVGLCTEVATERAKSTKELRKQFHTVLSRNALFLE